MGDVLDFEFIAQGKEWRIIPEAFSYLVLAEKAGLGKCERGNPQTNSYSKINFLKKDL
jgi:hypothetical protein